MAKKAKKAEVDETTKLLSENNLEDKRIKKKSRLPLILLVLFIGVLAAVFALNLFGAREKFLYPIAKNIPLVKNLVPSQEENQALSKDELIAKVSSLESELTKINEEYTTLETRFNDRGTEINSLQHYKSMIEQFNTDKAAFDEAVANNDKEAFIKFYENMFPENSEKLYKETLVAAQNDKELKRYVNTFSEMDESAAAGILEKMIGTDMDLVVKIMKTVDTNTGANILAQMQTDNAANIAKRMAPAEE